MFIVPDTDLKFMDKRISIRDLILNGCIDEAIQKINSISKKIL